MWLSKKAASQFITFDPGTAATFVHAASDVNSTDPAAASDVLSVCLCECIQESVCVAVSVQEQQCVQQQQITTLTANQHWWIKTSI